MIGQIKYIQNVGRFAQVQGHPDLALKRLNLIYSENGRGKTTLCAVLRSLSGGDSAPILERHRLSSRSESKVVLDVDGNEAVFDGNAWNTAGPPVLVFDEHFVDANVHSGLSIGPGHRQNLHVLVIGEEGVRYQRRVEELGEEIAKLQLTVRERQAAIPPTTLGELQVDDFCALPPVDDIESKLEELRKGVSVLRDAEKVLTTPDFEPFALPLLGVGDIRSVLRTSLPSIEQIAVDAVLGHLASLGDESESWVSDGVEFLAEGESCPFCGQGVSGSNLITHYRVYFSEAYRELDSNISAAKTQIEENFGGDALVRTQRSFQQAGERHEFWSKYVNLPDFDIDVEEVVAAWAGARDVLLEALSRKAGAPLEPIELDPSAEVALARYETAAEGVRTLSGALLALDESVSTAKEKAQHGSLPTAEAELELLEATAQRYDNATLALCTAYLDAKREKTSREEEKDEARQALKQHRDRVFGIYQSAINHFLVKFNADFQIKQLAPSDARGVPSSSYEFVVNQRHIGTAPTDDPQPSFATVLSSGDRNTLALAFFFATLQQRSSLEDVIVVIDDPASSLDDGRAFATVQEIRALVGRANQVVVLAHSRPILCQIWEHADNDTTTTIEIRNEEGVAEASTLAAWDAEAAAITDFDRLHTEVREYADTFSGKAQEVAVALRPVLEGFLRVAFVEWFPPGTSLGEFLRCAKQESQDGRPILSDEAIEELDNLREYANQFHHTKSLNWQENLSNVNENQLKGYARRVVDFTHIGQSANRVH